MPANTLEQLERFKFLLRAGPYDPEHPLFQKSIDWIRSFPGDLSEAQRVEVCSLIRDAFGLTDEQLQLAVLGQFRKPVLYNVDAAELERELLDLIPKGGFFDRYVTYTSHSEAPLAYHLFSALVGVGANVNRRVWFDMGYYRLFPNLGIIILGPSGIKKTSAANIMVNMLSELEMIKIYSEKLTPEQLIEAMKDMPQGLIYAPEMAVFLGRQRYMEGIVPLITRFMDCPDVWSSETIMRGKKTLRDVAVSSLMCSTLDWFITNTSEDVVSGGFIARNIIVAQEQSPRLEPIPKPGDRQVRQNLMSELSRVHELSGELTFTPKVLATYDAWYRDQKRRMGSQAHELLKTYYERKPDHVKRVAMCLHLADHCTLTLCPDCFDRALAILDWVEKFLPAIVRRLFKTSMGHDQDLVLATIKASGGIIDHGLLMRRLQYKGDSRWLKNLIESLKEADQIEEVVDKLMHVYRIKERRFEE